MAKTSQEALPACCPNLTPHHLPWPYLPGTVWVGSGYADAVPGLERWGNSDSSQGWSRVSASLVVGVVWEAAGPHSFRRQC